MIEFQLDTASGVATYLQLVQQVHQALQLGILEPGDQLPTAQQVVAKLAINPNTVLKAYRELEYQGLAAARPGIGTFVTGTLGGSSLAAHRPLRRDLQRWLAKARRAGLDDESIEALFISTDAPVYAGLSVADHLRLGAHLNPGWDAELADSRIERLDLSLGQKAGTLSGGQRAQLALTLAVAKRPDLLLLDEPVASLDPLARREFLQDLMAAVAVAEQGLSVVLSSHLISDLERVCDYLIVLVASRVRVAGPVEELLATHHLLSGPRRDPGTLPAGQHVISASHTDRQTTLLVRTSDEVLDPVWTAAEVGLEDLVLAYMHQAAGRGRHNHHLQVQS